MNIYKPHIYLILTFSLAAFRISFSQTAYTSIESSDSLFFLNNQSEFLIDTSASMGFEQVKNAKFQKFNPALISKVSWNDVIWQKVTVKNHLSESSKWELHTGKASLIDVYIQQLDGNYLVKKTGFYRKNSEKEEIRGKENPVVLTLLPQLDEITFFVRFENKLKIKPVPKLVLQPMNGWQEFIIKRNLIEGVAQGILIVLFLYHLLLFFTIRERAYLYYCLYIVSLSVFYLNVYNFGREFFLGEFPVIFDYNWSVIQLVVIFFLLFISYFLNTKKDFPKKHLNIRILIFINLSWLIFGSIYLFLTKDLRTIFTIHSYFNFIQFINILILLGLFWKSGITAAQLLVIGTFFFVIGGLWDLRFRNPMEYTALHINFLQFGAIIQLILFSVSIGYKMRVKDKEIQLGQEKLIGQLKENEMLQDTVNRELEEKVKIRTQKLQEVNEQLWKMNDKLQNALNQVDMQKQEIEKQKEDISLQADQLKEQNDKLFDLNHDKARLFSIIAHDLKAPLNALKGLLFLFEADVATEEELKKFIPEVSKDINHTSNLFNNLLSWAKSQMDGTDIHKEDINLQMIVDENIELLMPQADKKSIHLNSVVSEPILAFADKEMIKLVIRNLISNAIKFTPEDGEIKVNVTVKNSFAEVSVQDNGQGISEENRKKIFGNEVFTIRGTADEKGTGLGLILCKDFTEKNGGKIWVESEEGKGSNFIFTVPLQPQLEETWRRD